ncbi:response regulator [Foetidibacter luteolus]|uniref:response regulator n=1 Tax=Foetidibacter luteolus TaxID=2608880 RepID=UPI00129BA519|nr:response regulator [Foetidibacter luteolus]
MRQACYKALSHILKKEDFTCEGVSLYREGLALIEDFEHDCIIPDINLPGGTGLQLLQYLRDQHKEDGVIIISARDSPDEPLTCYYVTLPFGRRHCCLPKMSMT